MIGSKTTVLKKESVQDNWFVVDADGQITGRLATQIATVLMGKHRPDYTPHVACGDYVVVVNAERVRFSGAGVHHPKHPHFTEKFARKEYQRYTGYPSGRRVRTGTEMLEHRPTDILREAVRRMLPKNKLREKMLAKLKLYVGPNHPHQAQQPQPFPDYLAR